MKYAASRSEHFLSFWKKRRKQAALGEVDGVANFTGMLPGGHLFPLTSSDMPVPAAALLGFRQRLLQALPVDASN